MRISHPCVALGLARRSGASGVRALDQPCGKPTADEDRLLARRTLRRRLDAIFLLDRKVKHEACPIAQHSAQADADAGPALRDVLTIEVRRPRGGPPEGCDGATAVGGAGVCPARF